MATPSNMQAALLQSALKLRLLGMEIRKGVEKRKQRQLVTKMAARDKAVRMGSAHEDVDATVDHQGDAGFALRPLQAGGRSNRERQQDQGAELADAAAGLRAASVREPSSSEAMGQRDGGALTTDGPKTGGPRDDVVSPSASHAPPATELSAAELKGLVKRAGSEGRYLEAMLLDSLPWTSLHEVAVVAEALACTHQELTEGGVGIGPDVEFEKGGHMSGGGSKIGRNGSA